MLVKSLLHKPNDQENLEIVKLLKKQPTLSFY